MMMIFQRLTRSQRKDLYRGMANRIEAGASAIDAWAAMLRTLDRHLERLPRISRQLDPKAKLHLALSTFLVRVRDGSTIENCLVGFVPTTDIMAIGAGRRAESLALALNKLVESLDREQVLAQAIASAITYPIVLALLLCGLLYVYGIVLFPELGALVPKNRWPLSAVRVTRIAQFGVSYWPAVLAVIIGCGVGIVMVLQRYTGRFRVHLDHIPGLSLYRLSQGAAFVDAMHTLLAARIEPPQALLDLRKSGSPYFRSRISAISDEFRLGRSAVLSDALDNTRMGFPDQKYIDSLALSDDSIDVAQRVAQVNRDWLAATTQSIQASAKRMFYVGIFSVVLAIAAMMDAVYSLINQIRTF